MLPASKRETHLPCLAIATALPFATIRPAQAFATMQRRLEHQYYLLDTQ
jgi:hypothetical protein